MQNVQMEDRELVERILAGEKELYRTFVRRFERLVRQVVHRMLANSTDCDDIAQEVFIKIYTNLSGFKFNSRLSTWVGRISYNACLNHLDKKSVPLVGDLFGEEGEIDFWTDPNAASQLTAEQNDVSTRLCSEIDRLPVIYGTILSLYHLQEMQYNEIAEMLSLPVGTVKSYLFRARRMLKERLTAFYVVEELCA